MSTDAGTKPEVRDAARKLLELFGPNGEHWTQGTFARDADGREVMVRAPDAVCWCIGGAVRKLGIFISTSIELEEAIPGDYFADFNDSCTWPEMKAWLEGIAEEIQ